MSYTLTEQYVLDRIEERAEGLFWWVPETGTWLRKSDGFLVPDQAMEKLGGLYLAVVHSLSRVDDDSAAKSKTNLIMQRLSMSAIERALIGLTRCEKLQLPLEEINQGSMAWLENPPVGFSTRRAGGDVAVFCNSTEFLVFCREHLTRRVEPLKEFLVRTCAYEKPPMMVPSGKATPRLLVRDQPIGPDLSLLGNLLGSVMGDYLCHLPREIWSHWPFSLDPTWAFRLSGVRLVLLDGLDPKDHFPQAALKRLLSGDPVEYRGRDRLLHPFTPPSHFALCGPAIQPNRFKDFEITLREHSLSLPIPERWGGADELPSERLNDEGPSITGA